MLRMRNQNLKLSIFLLLTFFICQSLEAKKIDLQSPNGKLGVKIEITDKIYYSVSYDHDILLKDSYLQMSLRNEVLGKNPKLKNEKRSRVNEEIKPHIPLKFSTVQNSYNKLLLNFNGNYSVEFRAFDEGIAYRFITNKKGDVEVLSEDVAINFTDDYSAHIQQPLGFKTAYEELYSNIKVNEWNESDKMAVLPMLLDTKKQYKILVSESDLSDYPCLFFKGKGSNGMQSVFPKVPLEFGEDGDRSVKILKEADYIAKTKGARSFPWRYFVITKSDKELLENTMTLKLASPSMIVNTSWIKPGQVSWEWWNDASPYGTDVNFESGYNLDTYKYYIDFASKYGIEYIIMDEGWAMTTRDPYTPNPKVDVHELIRYGKEKNVRIVLWLTWLTVENNFDLFKTFKEWGVAGVKIDFMDRSDQWMVNYYERVAKEAAKYELFVDFHGSFKPAGLEYTYPNVLSYEGVRGMEQMGGCFPDNSLYLPFIRNAVGPMDYTPGAMISMQPDVYCGQRPNSASIGTRAYQLALFVVFESGIQMLADNPTMYYRNSDCTEFITQVPTTWDETRVIDAKVGEFVIVAKRKNDKWYIGAICNGKEDQREFEVSLDFLKNDRVYAMTWFEDGINAKRQAMDYRKKEAKISSIDKVKIKMVKNGGWAAILQ